MQTEPHACGHVLCPLPLPTDCHAWPPFFQLRSPPASPPGLLLAQTVVQGLAQQVLNPGPGNNVHTY